MMKIKARQLEVNLAALLVYKWITPGIPLLVFKKGGMKPEKYTYWYNCILRTGGADVGISEVHPRHERGAIVGCRNF